MVSLSVFGQQKKNIHHFKVDIRNGESLVVTPLDNGTLKIENPDAITETAIYSIFTIYTFQKAYPNTTKETFKNRYRVSTNSGSLLYELQKQFPEKYSNIEAYAPLPNAFYPNDYGTTSPVENLGASFPMTGLDLINAPGAWGITKGDPKVIIGISDARVDSTNTDLEGRVSNYLRYFDTQTGSTCAHGSGVAGIIGAKKDNAFGIPGICSECDLITHGYGRFDYIQELVEAGAKVINASWAMCGFGPYHQNVQERINEYYDEGILIVAAAGNSRRCNPYLIDFATSYTYPASFKNVISVTTVYAECGHFEDCIIDDEQFGPVAYKLKDRHVRRHFMAEEGSFDQLTPINIQWATQHNLGVDIAAPAETFSIGRADCGLEGNEFLGLTSASAAFVTGVIGLIWSANYCLASAEVESILKLSSEDIENLPGNEQFKMQLGAGRVDAYRAVKMAYDMQLDKGTVEVANRDFYRFDFKLFSSPYQIEIKNQTFRDSSTVDFKARKRIHLKPGTRLAPDANGYVKLSIDPSLPTEECFPKPVVKRPKVERDSVPNPPRHAAPFILERNLEIRGVQVSPVDGVLDTDYVVVIETDKEVFRKNYKKEETALIPLPEIENQAVTVTVTSKLYQMQRSIRVNTP